MFGGKEGKDLSTESATKTKVFVRLSRQRILNCKNTNREFSLLYRNPLVVTMFTFDF